MYITTKKEQAEFKENLFKGCKMVVSRMVVGQRWEIRQDEDNVGLYIDGIMITGGKVMYNPDYADELLSNIDYAHIPS